jgi:hypothetical protein
MRPHKCRSNAQLGGGGTLICMSNRGRNHLWTTELRWRVWSIKPGARICFTVRTILLTYIRGNQRVRSQPVGHRGFCPRWLLTTGTSEERQHRLVQSGPPSISPGWTCSYQGRTIGLLLQSSFLFRRILFSDRSHVIFPHSGIPFDIIFEQNKRGVANAEEYSFYFGVIL